MGNIRICLKFMKLIMWNTAEENLLDLYVDSEAQGKATEMGNFDQVIEDAKGFSECRRWRTPKWPHRRSDFLPNDTTWRNGLRAHKQVFDDYYMGMNSMKD
ncbi:hypothetical protein QJS10_CPB11g01634 [Acorus calamus]|uniref:Uncharacterized protein n=1 Tax=Acorus calamus TaxID=4465 RepID=A0AAV9DPU6_ACOCL|nr:hypothetical protein QJS10_CPB11g01634 [Acorus calamus]